MTIANQNQTRIFLIGFMGSGKSYLGSRLASHLAMDFIDLDELIVERAEKSIPEIFAEEGETAFRALELACLRSLGQNQNIVVACGGGTPCFFGNMDWMQENGTTIFLDASVELLWSRLKTELSERPLLAGKDKAELQAFLEQTLAERRPVYEQATILLKQDQEVNTDEILEEISRKVRLEE